MNTPRNQEELENISIQQFNTQKVIMRFQKQRTPQDYNMKRLAPIKTCKDDYAQQEQSFSVDYSQIIINQDLRSMGVRPKYNQKQLIKNLKSQLVINNQKTIKKYPIEYYQIQLYDLCKKINVELPGVQLKIQCIYHIHHILRLKKMENQLDGQDLESINENLQEVMKESPFVFPVYQVFKQGLQLISDLAVKYNIINFHDYYFRFSGRSLVANLIDLNELNQTFFTMECLWFAFMVDQLPLNEIVSDLAKQSGKVLLRSVEKTLIFMAELNCDCPFSDVPSIRSLLAAKKPFLAEFLGVEGDYEAQVVDYQRLKVDRGFLGWCMQNPDLKSAQQLKGMIKDIEFAYRTFEQELVGCVLANIK